MAENVFHEVARWRLDEQLTAIRELNTRLSVVFASATALLVLFAAFQDFSGITENAAALALLSTGGVVYVLLVTVTAFAYVDRRLNLGPALEEVRDASLTSEEPYLRRWVAEETMRAVAGNQLRVARKRLLTALATALWAIDVLLFAGAVITHAL